MTALRGLLRVAAVGALLFLTVGAPAVSLAAPVADDPNYRACGLGLNNCDARFNGQGQIPYWSVGGQVESNYLSGGVGFLISPGAVMFQGFTASGTGELFIDIVYHGPGATVYGQSLPAQGGPTSATLDLGPVTAGDSLTMVVEGGSGGAEYIDLASVRIQLTATPTLTAVPTSTPASGQSLDCGLVKNCNMWHFSGGFNDIPTYWASYYSATGWSCYNWQQSGPISGGFTGGPADGWCWGRGIYQQFSVPSSGVVCLDAQANLHDIGIYLSDTSGSVYTPLMMHLTQGQRRNDCTPSLAAGATVEIVVVNQYGWQPSPCCDLAGGFGAFRIYNVYQPPPASPTPPPTDTPGPSSTPGPPGTATPAPTGVPETPQPSPTGGDICWTCFDTSTATVIATATPSATLSLSATPSDSPSPSDSQTPVASPSASPSPTGTPTPCSDCCNIICSCIIAGANIVADSVRTVRDQLTTTNQDLSTLDTEVASIPSLIGSAITNGIQAAFSLLFEPKDPGGDLAGALTSLESVDPGLKHSLDVLANLTPTACTPWILTLPSIPHVTATLGSVTFDTCNVPFRAVIRAMSLIGVLVAFFNWLVRFFKGLFDG